MGYLKERVSYLKGLAEGMQLNDSSNETKLLKAIIEVLDDMSLAVEDVEEVQEQISEQIDTIDDDLAEIEKLVYDEDDDDDSDEEIYFTEIECPYCNEKINIDEDMIDDEDNTIECPNCHKEIEFEWDCECDDHDHDHDHEHKQ